MVSENPATEMPGSSTLRESQSKGNRRAVGSSEAPGSANAPEKHKITDHGSEVIVACPIPLTSANEMIDSAKGEIIEVLRSDELCARPVDDRLLVGNPRGLDHASRLSRLEIIENDNQDLKTDMDRLKGERKEQAGELADARARIRGLEDSVGDLHNTRSRFISFAKRDKFKSATHHDFQIIAAGNRDVHGGNVIADVRLYTHGHRTDFDVYEFLYGC